MRLGVTQAYDRLSIQRQQGGHMTTTAKLQSCLLPSKKSTQFPAYRGYRTQISLHFFSQLDSSTDFRESARKSNENEKTPAHDHSCCRGDQYLRLRAISENITQRGNPSRKGQFSEKDGAIGGVSVRACDNDLRRGSRLVRWHRAGQIGFRWIGWTDFVRSYSRPLTHSCAF